MRVREGGKDDPFCDLGTMDARRGSQGNFGGRVDRGVGDVVRARGEDMYKL